MSKKGQKKKKTECGPGNNLVTEVRNQDEKHFENFMRTKKVDLDYNLEKESSRVRRKDTSMRRAITPKERLIKTLRYLATGRLLCFDIYQDAN
nr:unnamed protein product [Callosobruchus analis]